jgi:hypothetical protein
LNSLVFLRFCTGLLSGHGSMSLERLHTMLKLLSGGGGSGGGGGGAGAGGGGGGGADVAFTMSLPQLRQFLQAMVDQGKIEFLDGAYAPYVAATVAAVAVAAEDLEAAGGSADREVGTAAAGAGASAGAV